MLSQTVDKVRVTTGLLLFIELLFKSGSAALD